MIRELKTLIAVAQKGTFAAAGEKIGLTQAAVSAQMQRLESELGFLLFDRSSRAARLNPRGLQVLSQAQDLIRLYSNLGSRKTETDSETIITIGSIASMQRIVLPDVLTKFFSENRRCRVRVVPGQSMQLLDLVDAGEMDMAIVIRPSFSMHGDLQWSNLIEEPFKLLVPNQTKGTDWLSLLSSEPFVRYDRTTFGGRLVDRFLRSLHIPVREVCELDELEAIFRLVANGTGVALVPQLTGFKRWPAAVRAINLGDQTFYRDIGLVHRSKASLSKSARELATLVTASYGNERKRHKAPDRGTTSD